MQTAPPSVPQKSSPLQQSGAVDKQVMLYPEAGSPHTVPEARFPLILELTEVPLFLLDVPLSTFVSVGSALGLSFSVKNPARQSRSKNDSSGLSHTLSAVERVWHIYESPGHILALVFK